MIIIQAGPEHFRFEISWEEKELLNVIRLYPHVPAAHHRLTKGRRIPDRAENQQLLEEALQAQREENRQLVATLLNEPARFAEIETGFRVGFTRGEIEWLLQVLNDVRVGSWIALGSPPGHPELQPGLSNETMSHIMTMDVAGFFEMAFLHALTGEPLTGDA